jgi:hypothetical protein
MEEEGSGAVAILGMVEERLAKVAVSLAVDLLGVAEAARRVWETATVAATLVEKVRAKETWAEATAAAR